MTIFLSAAALVVAVVAAFYARNAAVAANRAAAAAHRSADVAELTERRDRTPQLAILLDNPVPAPADRVIYRVRNDGPQDLDALTIYRPRPADGSSTRLRRRA